MKKRLLKFRFLSILWMGIMAIVCSVSATAQFDEPSKNQWVIDFSYGFLGHNNPYLTAGKDRPQWSFDCNKDYSFCGDVSSTVSITFGVNRCLFGNIYAGIQLGYKYYGGNLYNVRKCIYGKFDEWLDMSVSYNLAILPIEIGYNRAFNHKKGFNIYISAIPGYSFASSASYNYCDVENPGLCIDSALGLKYYIRHVYLGMSYHIGLNNGQKKVAENNFVVSAGYRF